MFSIFHIYIIYSSSCLDFTTMEQWSNYTEAHLQNRWCVFKNNDHYLDPHLVTSNTQVCVQVWLSIYCSNFIFNIRSCFWKFAQTCCNSHSISNVMFPSLHCFENWVLAPISILPLHCEYFNNKCSAYFRYTS